MSSAMDTNIEVLWGQITQRNGPKIGLPAEISYTVQTIGTTGSIGTYREVKPIRRGIDAQDIIEAADAGELCVVQIGGTTPPASQTNQTPQIQVVIYLMCPELPPAGPCNTPPAQPTGGG